MTLQFLKKYGYIVPCLLFASVFFASTTQASSIPTVSVRDEGFAVKYMGQSIADPITIEAGDTVDVVFTFKNVGTKTWDSSSRNYVSAYTMEPRYRNSLFHGNNWLASNQTAKIEGVVAPGQTGQLHLTLTAPEKTGRYVEKFWLAADGWSWVKGGYFYTIMNVVEKKPTEEVVVPAVTEDSSTTTDEVAQTTYHAKQLFVSKKSIEAVGGEQIDLTLAFQNTGESTWHQLTLLANSPDAPELGLAAGARQLTFADESWENASRVISKTEDIEQWGIAKQHVSVRAPVTSGDYTLRFYLDVDGTRIDAIRVEIPMHVTADAPSHYQVPAFVRNDDVLIEETPRLTAEPSIRVGLWKNPEEAVQFVSHDDNYLVYAGDVLKGTLPKDQRASFSQAAGHYAFTSDELVFTAQHFIRLVPENNPHAIFELVNYTRPASWKGPYNFNKYRGTVELRLTIDGYNNTYIVNELLYEDYVAGIAETSNSSDIEYIKALLTAARTYAYYVAEHSSKHDERFFDVVATTGDQLYLGYMSEKTMPRVKQAQEETRGYMVTYNNDVVITPYFGNSDGRTRSWTDVWGGKAKPWLVSVPAVYDLRDGKSMYGHGVGMSARDAAYKAEEEDVTWKDLLKYYYTGVEVAWMWK